MSLDGLQTIYSPFAKMRKAAICVSAASALALAALAAGPLAAKESKPEVSNIAKVGLNTLPKEAQTTYALIRAGGPFPYDKDGTRFGNRERILPQATRGYYREYTVKTPRARTRGAKRIVCGGEVPSAPAACYYTDDHYQSFRQISTP